MPWTSARFSDGITCRTSPRAMAENDAPNPDPDVLQLARPTPQHVAFAFGTYYCIGNALARSEVQVALRSLLDHFPTLHPAGETFEWRTTLRNRGPAELRVAW